MFFYCTNESKKDEEQLQLLVFLNGFFNDGVEDLPIIGGHAGQQAFQRSGDGRGGLERLFQLRDEAGLVGGNIAAVLKPLGVDLELLADEHALGCIGDNLATFIGSNHCKSGADNGSKLGLIQASILTDFFNAFFQ